MISLSTVVLEDRSLALEFVPQDGGIDEVAVVADRDLTASRVEKERLRVGQRARSGGRIADVADGAISLQAIEVAGGEYLGHKPHVHVPQEGRIRTGGGYDTGALLPAMLQGKEAVVGQNGGVGMAKNGENAALMGRFVVLHAGQGEA